MKNEKIYFNLSRIPGVEIKKAAKIIFGLGNQRYAALCDVDENGCFIDDSQADIYRIEGDEDGEFEIIPIEECVEYYVAEKYYREWYAEEYGLELPEKKWGAIPALFLEYHGDSKRLYEFLEKNGVLTEAGLKIAAKMIGLAA